MVKNLTTECKDSTKTESSRRKFTMTEDIRDMLLKHKAEVEQAAKDNPAYTRSAYICTDKNGVLLRPDSLTRGFQRVLHKNGLQHMRFHDLRHPYVKHTTKKYNSEKQKTQATKMDLIAWVFRFCTFNYSKRSWTL